MIKKYIFIEIIKMMFNITIESLQEMIEKPSGTYIIYKQFQLSRLNHLPSHQTTIDFFTILKALFPIITIPK